MFTRMLFVALVAFALTACSRAGELPDDPAAVLVVRVEGDATAVAAALTIANERLHHLGAGAAELIPGEPVRLRVLLTSPWHTRAELAKRVVTSPGTFAFRAVPSAAIVKKEREARRGLGERYVPSDPAFVWIPHREELHGDRTYQLVIEPERPLLAEIANVEARAAAAADTRLTELRKALRALRDASVFTESAIADARPNVVEYSHAHAVVMVDIVDDRAEAFESFTRGLIGQQVALILDGTVQSTSRVNSELQGNFCVESGGLGGFREAEAHIVAAILAAGRAMPVTLVTESFDVLR